MKNLERRLSKLEEDFIAAQQRERHIQIRWIGKGEKLRPGLRCYPEPVANDHPNFCPAGSEIAAIEAQIREVVPP
jgi:hypothetical protein